MEIDTIKSWQIDIDLKEKKLLCFPLMILSVLLQLMRLMKVNYLELKMEELAEKIWILFWKL